MRPGISASTWWPDRYRIIDDPLPRPPAQDAALFRREDIDAAARGEAISLETLDRLVRLVESLPPPPPAALVVPSWVVREAERFASSPYYPQEGRRLRGAVKWARDHLAAQPRPVEGCVVGGCTAEGSWRWPTLDGGTVPVCERHHDAATRLAEGKGLDDEEALWRAGREA